MKRITSIVAAGAISLGSVIAIGAGVASAAQATPTVVLSGAAGTFPGTTPPLVATTSVAGSVTFTAAGATISGCSGVATTTVAPFLATCAWAATAAGPVAFGASFVPTDTTDNANATAATYNVTIAPPIQGNTGPISFIVDAVGTANSCGIQSQFVVGDGIVFRVAANDAALGGAALTSANVSSASISVTGFATPVVLSYANHGGLGMWTGVLQTGTAAGDYSPTGAIPYTITMNTIAVPAVTKKVHATKLVSVVKNGQRTHKRVTYIKTVVVTPAVPGATGTFSPSHTLSVLTLLAAPVTLK
jgi:hypothetical protein